MASTNPLLSSALCIGRTDCFPFKYTLTWRAFAWFENRSLLREPAPELFARHRYSISNIVYIGKGANGMPARSFPACRPFGHGEGTIELRSNGAPLRLRSRQARGSCPYINLSLDGPLLLSLRFSRRRGAGGRRWRLPVAVEQERVPRRRIFKGVSSGKVTWYSAVRRASVKSFSFSSPLMNFTASAFAGEPAAPLSRTKKSALPVSLALPRSMLRSDCRRRIGLWPRRDSVWRRI